MISLNSLIQNDALIAAANIGYIVLQPLPVFLPPSRSVVGFWFEELLTLVVDISFTPALLKHALA